MERERESERGKTRSNSPQKSQEFAKREGKIEFRMGPISCNLHSNHFCDVLRFLRLNPASLFAFFSLQFSLFLSFAFSAPPRLCVKKMRLFVSASFFFSFFSSEQLHLFPISITLP